MQFPNKRVSFGTAMHNLINMPLTERRYLAKYYPVYDWSNIHSFFYDNQIQANIILNDFKLSSEVKIRTIVNELYFGKSKICIICGGRGSGKTALVMFLMNELNCEFHESSIYFVGEDIDAGVFPPFIKVVDDIESVPSNSIAIVDEASIKYFSRNPMTDDNKAISNLISIARHHDLTIIFITQHLSLIDVNIFKMRDLIFLLQSADYNVGERGGKRSQEDRFFKKVRNMMMPRKIGSCLFEQPLKRRFIHFDFDLPPFWNENISKLFKDYNPRQKMIEARANKVRDKENRQLAMFQRKQEIKAGVFASKGLKIVEEKPKKPSGLFNVDDD